MKHWSGHRRSGYRRRGHEDQYRLDVRHGRDVDQSQGGYELFEGALQYVIDHQLLGYCVPEEASRDVQREVEAECLNRDLYYV